MADLKIIQGNLEHLEDLSVLFDQYRVFYRQTSDVAAAKSFLQERLSNLQSLIFLVYWQDKPAGFTQLYPMFSSVSLGKSWVLNDLFVQPAFRKKGIGEALLKKAAEFARASNIAKLTLATEIDNQTAQSLYEKMGWKRSEGFYHYQLTFAEK